MSALRPSKQFIRILVVITLLGAIARFYRISDTLMFQGDQGRDALVVKRMLYDSDLTLLGPTTSVGGMYLGPLYYYFMAPFLAFSYPDPVGPALGVALLDSLAIVGVGLLGWYWFGSRVGLIGALLYACSAVAIYHARFSWNPNLAGFTAVALALLSYWYVQKPRSWLLGLMGLVYGALIQMHYVAILAASLPLASVVISWLKHRYRWTEYGKHLIAGMMGFFITLVPLILFDIRNRGIVRQAFGAFLQGGDGLDLSRVIIDLHGKTTRILAHFSLGPDSQLNTVIIVGCLIGWTLTYWLWKRPKPTSSYLLLFAWLWGGIAGSTLYDGIVYDHYLLYLIPALSLSLALAMEWLWHPKLRYGFMVVGVLLAALLSYNLKMHPLNQLTAPARGVEQYALTSEAILELMDDEAIFNIALLADSKDYRGMNYRYFLETRTDRILHEYQYQGMDVLVVIDEQSVQDPLSQDAYEVTSSGPKKLLKQATVQPGLKVYVYEILNNDEN